MTDSVATRRVRATLVAVSVGGMVCFAGIFAASVLARPTIERAAKDYLVARVTADAQESLGDRWQPAVGSEGDAEALRAKLGETAAMLQGWSDARLPEAVGALIASFCDIDCEEQKAAAADSYGAILRDALESTLKRTHDKMAGLRAFVVGAYHARLIALIGEVRLVAGINLALFAGLALLLWLRRHEMRPVLVPAALLCASTVATLALYVTAQDWLWSILLGDFVGYGYLAWFAGVFLLLADIALNEARVSNAVIALIPVPVPPC